MYTYDVLLCTYNGEAFIREQINSILIQEIKPTNIIVSDDGSTDVTINIIKDLATVHSDVKFKFINGPMKGVCSNFLSALKYAESDFLFFSDQDDIWLANKVKIFYENLYRVNFIEKPILLFSDSYVFNDSTKNYNQTFFKSENLCPQFLEDDSLLFRNCVQGASMMINLRLVKLCIKSLGIINEEKILMHDWWIALLAKYNGECAFINQPLLLYRQHDCNIIGVKRHRSIFFNLPLLYKYWVRWKKINDQFSEFYEFEEKFNKIKLSVNMNRIRHVGFLKKILLYISLK